ncbi:MAG: CRISPR-associated helicase Cas3', partial [Ktedonobacterales bacterium]
MAILPSKFNTLRLLGLADKVLVLDEVHAYDAYLRTEVKALLRFQASLGGSAILLSATIPRKLRAELVREWRNVVTPPPVRSLWSTRPEPDGVQRTEYPLATVISASETTEAPVESASWSKREVSVRFVHADRDAVERIVAAANAGCAVAWVRNTVDTCRAAAEDIRRHGIEPIVFHARFAQCDRQAREAEVTDLFGKGKDGARRGRVLIATQVIEQSLDIDFDFMVSDLAPIDLLIQRAGRLWRHKDRSRPITSGPELVVLSPRFTEAPDDDWLKALLPHTDLIYGSVDVLWRTLRALLKTNKIVTPDGLRDLIEEVYAGDECPRNLMERADRALAAEGAALATAGYVALKPEGGYSGEVTTWLSDTHVPTRLGEEQVVLRLGRVMHDGRIEPWAETDGPAWERWSLSEVRVTSRWFPPGSSVDRRYA